MGVGGRDPFEEGRRQGREEQWRNGVDGHLHAIDGRLDELEKGQQKEASWRSAVTISAMVLAGAITWAIDHLKQIFGYAPPHP